MKAQLVATTFFTVVLACGVALGEEQQSKSSNDKENKLEGIKCLFCKMQVQEDVFVEYKDAKVYLGCEGCVGAFKRDVKKVATKANAQLVATKQAKQKACPLSGRPCKEDFKVTVGKAKVNFCCANCQKTASELKGDEQLEKLFSEKTFKKAFEVPKPKTKTEKS
jgi:hypothetical protein